jgi:probable HAF family extracellular repeat protein
MTKRILGETKENNVKITTAILLLAFFASAEAQILRYHVTVKNATPVLATPGPYGGGGGWCFVSGMSNRGQIVGTSVCPGDPYFDPYYNHAFLITNGYVQDVGVLGFGRWSWGEAVNDHGQVVGFSYYLGTDVIGAHPFLWTAGHMTDLGTIGGVQEGVAWAVNDRAVVVGSSPDRTGLMHAFYWDGVMHDLGVGSAVGINNANQIVGNVTNSFGSGPFLWKNGEFQFLPMGVHAINNSGIIIFGNQIYVDGNVYTLTPSGSDSVGFAINDRNQILGSYNGNYVIWQVHLAGRSILTSTTPKGAPRITMRTLSFEEGWSVNPIGIDDFGQLAGTGVYNGVKYVVLLDPVY